MAKKGRIQKKQYCTPKITEINLKSEEAVLSGCKTSSQAELHGAAYAPYCKWRGSSCSEILS